MRTLNKVRLIDYKEPEYLIPNIFLDISIMKSKVKIISTYDIKTINVSDQKIKLKGVCIELESIKINNYILNSNEYKYSNDNLEIINITKRSFKLTIISYINPYNNTSLEGLYKSNQILTSQCEAEGFRRICFHPDRPDILSKYTVRIESDLNQFPILLSNGNQISEYKILNRSNRHEVIWSDPFPKPSYLFALVAGKLIKTNGTYNTISGKEVKINIYVEKNDAKYTSHALLSLKKAMQWDEEVYGFEYDLDIYNIVAIRHFNMGAMENKSLNIFNSKLILANSEIATDTELERIESVIAHEYFHNWTGNRITCRDWFQLSLKEGLTVFRDQSFTADLHSYGIKRIEDVSMLRRTQFKEDNGPTAHAVKPKEYNSIDNFYTTTIYEKGAEIIRMLQTIIGKDSFILGIKKYAKDFDGKAATTEDFINSIIEGACENGYKINFNIDQFMDWYYEYGTPNISIKREWDCKKGELKLIIKQELLNNKNYKPRVIPINMAFIYKNSIKEKIIILQNKEEIYTFKGLHESKEIPVLSYFREFSSPVNWETDLTIDEKFYLATNEKDMFSRWNIFQSMYKEAIVSRASKNPKHNIEKLLVHSLSKIINNLENERLDFLASILKFPSIQEVELSQDPINPIEIYNSYYYLSSFIANKLSSTLEYLVDISKSKLLESWPKGKESRKLMNTIWGLLIFSKSVDIKNDLLNVIKGNSMTLSISALNAIKLINCKERDQAMLIFFDRWKDNPVVLDTWFNLESSIPRTNSLDITKSLLNHYKFDFKSPNSIRSLLGGFISNTSSFHSKDGKGYLFIAEQIINIDTKNPITASKLIKTFSNWKKYIEPNSQNMFNAIDMIRKRSLSSNSREIIELILDN